MIDEGRRHLAETGFGYAAHLGRAWRIGGRLAVAGGACFIHGLAPGLFKDKATSTITRLHSELKKGPDHASERQLIEFEI